MLSLKKYLTEGLIQFTILLSLMGVRVDLDSYLPSHLPPLHEIILGPTSAYTQTQFHSLRGTSEGYGVHPKSVDLDQFFTSRRLLSRMRALDRLQVPSTELDAWLVHREADGSVSSAQTGSSRSADSPQNLPTSESSLRDSIDNEPGRASEELGASAQCENTELVKEEIDPIDILWLQDIDLGAGREDFESRQNHKDNEDAWESLGDSSGSEDVEHRIQVDGETGENVPQEGQTAMSLAECLSLLDDTFQFDSTEFPAPAPTNILDTEPGQTGLEQADSLLSPFLPNIDTPLDLEEQWQDLMSLMDMQPMDINGSSEDPLYLSMDPSLQQNEGINQTAFQGCSQNMSLYSPPMEHFAVPESPLPQLSSHNSTDLNSTFGFTNFSGILFPSQQNSTANVTSTNVLQDPLGGILDEALLDEISLMELAMEEGFSQMQTSQLQEELDSDSGLSLDSHRSPVSPSGSETSSSSCSSSSSSSSFSEEGAVGYSSDSEMVEHDESEESIGYQPEYSKFCRMSSEDPSQFQRLLFLEHVGHNHTYNMVPEEPEEEPEPSMGRGSRRSSGFIDRQAGRDEQRARAMKIPFSNEKIINLPVEEFNELLTKYQLTEAQLCLVRDIRRRGKNKMAAQNCRKRKLDTIVNLEQEVKRLSRERSSQLREKGENLRSLQRMKQEVESLYQEVFSQLRDQEGRPYSAQRYALHYTSNGNIVLMPRNAEGQQSRRSERKDRRK
ncbi:endoplasmic reticulum membrane sensor NFE2L1 isoform X1 [Rana temporaria]|uniref:endoplasmic reticulum membrane sensor NFE2L1 isoform X1 n=1 Tax=Rana temporaria TaxID=8407 RepID=UPI001AAC5E5F|nr:endoplasmic reticulum membrane sensor NFE2L1 isoform X1 [Rana temporaria]XP_040187252.1 endoplasmic reticulum membrane sensor NFE2L1 isoform X1 [Rana temporaria]XP_040187253.1 endoplasmic reticulum membrane sensor NFE2L1 isoform X1 [Rana temporaria]